MMRVTWCVIPKVRRHVLSDSCREGVFLAPECRKEAGALLAELK